MDFRLTESEEKEVSHITIAAYNAWVLVNDYFSWEKETLNHQANGGKGEIVSAVFLFRRWFNLKNDQDAKAMLKAEIISREKMYCDLKEQYMLRNVSTEKIRYWFTLLDLVTAGNFAWSMTTARYLKGPDSYPDLRAKHQASHPTATASDLDKSISQSMPVNGHTSGLSNGKHLAPNRSCDKSTLVFLDLPRLPLVQYEEVGSNTL